jgi:signal transduction histidine kinase
MDLENQSREQLLTRIRELEERLAGSGPSERRHAEAQQAQLRRALEEKNAELEARHAEMESFTYAISHDLKAPLITISGFLAEIESAALSGNVERLKADLERIGAAAERMRGMVDEILMLSRAGQMISTLDEVSLTQVAREAVRLVSGQLERAGVEVTIHEPLPKIIGDKARLLQVMQNLVDNGVKFLGDQPHPKIEIGGSESPDRVGIYVADNGIGIAPKDQQRAFQLFQRLDRKVEGTGFGLALVKKIVEAHRGRVWIESEGRNQGTRVCFSLPKIGKIAEMLREASG